MRRQTFRCDDAAGFELRVLQADDGDFHVSVVPNRETFDREHEGEDALFAGCYSASVRIRMPMIGGGSHEKLWRALASVFAAMPAPPSSRVACDTCKRTTPHTHCPECGSTEHAAADCDMRG